MFTTPTKEQLDAVYEELLQRSTGDTQYALPEWLHEHLHDFLLHALKNSSGITLAVVMDPNTMKHLETMLNAWSWLMICAHRNDWDTNLIAVPKHERAGH